MRARAYTHTHTHTHTQKKMRNNYFKIFFSEMKNGSLTILGSILLLELILHKESRQNWSLRAWLMARILWW